MTGKFIIAGVFTYVLLLAVQIGTPVWVTHVFGLGQVDGLNRLTQVGSAQSLNFYLGRMEELVWGPAVAVLSGILLVLIALGPLKNISGLRYCGVIFLFLVATKWNVLLFPPYGDSVGGPFAEGWWLARHGFDYIGLLNQPGYAQGGPKAYMTSAFPTYLAVMYTLFSSVKLFLVVNHLVFFAMAAGVAAFVRSIARRIFCIETASLLAALILSWPVFQSQLEALNMELPSLFFAVACAWALARGRIHWAGAAALVSLFFKGSGIFACAGFFCFGLLEWRGEKDPLRRTAWLFWGLGLTGAAVLVVALKFLMGDQHASAGMISPLVGWASLRQFPITYFYIANIALFTVWVLVKHSKKSGPANASDPECAAVRINTLMLIFAGMWFLLFLNFVAVSPRYRVAVYPFLLFSLVWMLARVLPWRMIQVAGLCAGILLVQFNAYGWRNTYIGVDYVLTEENLQYRSDLKLYQELARTVEEKYARFPVVVAPFISAQVLAIPDFGYVQHSRDVVIYGFNCLYGGIRAYPGLEGLDISRTIYTTMAIDQGSKEMPYPVHPNDKILEVVEWGNRKAWIFMGGFSIDMMRKIQTYLMLKQGKQS